MALNTNNGPGVRTRAIANGEKNAMPKVHRKIQFTAPGNCKGRPFTGGIYFKDGEVKITDKDLSFRVAADLIQTWPERFAWVGDPHTNMLVDSGKDSEDSSTDSSSSDESREGAESSERSATPETLDLSALDSNEAAAYTRARNKLDAGDGDKLTDYERETAIKVGDPRVEVND